MKTPVSPNCPNCGAALPADAPKGLCPRCLAAMNLATQTEVPGDEFGPEGTRVVPPSPRTAPLSPAELAPHFPQLEILDCLGRGGMGVVYKARQKSLNRFVALKLLAPERVRDAKFAERFTREAQALAALNHPNIVTVYDFGQAGGFYFLLMEFVDGLNLRQLLRARKLAPAEALAIVPPICEALQYAHEHGIVHRDIKPENLLLDKDGRVKIADFGIAKMLGAADGSGARLSPALSASEGEKEPGVTANTTAGTPGYMAPEQCMEPQKADHRADIYSLGVVLYELLTGELPGKRLEAPSRKVQIDVRLDEIVLRALEKTPELRYQTAADFRTEIEAVVNEPGTARPANRAHHSSPRLLKAGASYITTPEKLATLSGQFLLYRSKRQLILDDHQLTFARAGTNTVIPLTAIRDLSSGHYPWLVNPAGLDFISVTYDADGQTQRLFFSPCEGLVGLPSRFNEIVAEWFIEIRAAVTAATGCAPGNTPADHLGVPSSSKALWALLLFPLVLSGTLIFALARRRSDDSTTSLFRVIGLTFIFGVVFSFLSWMWMFLRASRQRNNHPLSKRPAGHPGLLTVLVVFAIFLVIFVVLFVVKRSDRAAPQVALAQPVAKDQAELTGPSRERMAVARVKLKKAETELERTTKLYAEQLIVQHELDQAKFIVELARAELTGNAMEVTRVRLRQAEDELERVSKLHAEQLVSQQEFNQAKFKVELIRAELAGDEVEVMRVRLKHAEEDFARASELLKQNLISESEYNQSKSALELSREELAKALQRKTAP